MPTIAPVDIPRPRAEAATIAEKPLEPYKSEVILNDFIGGQPPREFTREVISGLENPSPLHTSTDPVRDDAKRKIIQTYLEKNAGMKQELLEAAQRELEVKEIRPGSPQYENFLQNTLIQSAYSRVIEGMQIDNIKRVGSAVLEELQRCTQFMKMKTRLEEKVPLVGIPKHKFDSQKDTLATTRHTNFDELYRTPVGRQKFMAQAAGENQEELRRYLDTKAADEQFAGLTREQQIKMLSDASRQSLDRIELLGQQMLDRGEAVGGVLLTITNRWNEANSQKFDALVDDRRIREGAGRISREGGAIRLAENSGGATYVVMGANGQVSGITSNEAQLNPGGGKFADYHFSTEKVIGQMVGTVALNPPK